MSVAEIIERAEADLSQTIGMNVRIVWFKKRERQPRRKPPMNEAAVMRILQAVSEVFGFPVAEILGPSKSRKICDARKAAYKLILNSRSAIQADVADLFRRDHSNVWADVKTCENRIETEPDYAAKYNEAKRIIEEINA